METVQQATARMQTEITSDAAKLPRSEFAAKYFTFAQATAYVSEKSGKIIRYQQVYQRFMGGRLAAVQLGNDRFTTKAELDHWVSNRSEFLQRTRGR